MNFLTVETVDSDEGLAALEPEWRALERSSGNTLPFRTFLWNSCWWRHLRERRRAVSDSLAFRTVRTAERRLVGVAPLVLTERPGVGPFRTKTLRFIGADPNMTEVRGALCEPALEARCYAALYESLARAPATFDWMEWTGIDVTHGAREVLADSALQWSEGVVCSVLDLPPTWEALRAAAGRNLKESLRKCYNSLKRDGLTCSLTVVARPEEVAGAVADFFRLHTARAVSSDTPHHADVFAHPACKAFLLDVCERFAGEGGLRLFQLHVGEALVATRIGFLLGGCLYLYYSGFDPAYSKYAVMTTLVAEAIQHSINQGWTRVNLSTGRDESKRRWHPREVTFHEGLLVSGGPLERTKHAAFGWVERAVHQSAMRHYAERLRLVRRTVSEV